MKQRSDIELIIEDFEQNFNDREGQFEVGNGCYTAVEILAGCDPGEYGTQLNAYIDYLIEVEDVIQHPDGTLEYTDNSVDNYGTLNGD